MSSRQFYQTFYQHDQLFRLADDSWASPGKQPSVEVVDKPVDEVAQQPGTGVGLLSELDALSAETSAPVVESTRIDTGTEEAVRVVPGPAPVSVITVPEPLPQPINRPTVPSTIPPVQQPRMPQLNHKVLLLADEELDPSNLLFLEKILKAVNLNIDGVDLLNLHGARNLDFAELVQDKKIHHFITFGVPFSRIHLDIAMDRYQPVRFFGITFLMVDSLPTIEADQQLKKRLWGALQHIFLQR